MTRVIFAFALCSTPFPGTDDTRRAYRLYIGSMHSNLTLAYIQTDLTEDSTEPWAESDIDDKNAIILFKTHIAAVYMITKMGGQICASFALLKDKNASAGLRPLTP